jgi:hypothetical protein
MTPEFVTETSFMTPSSVTVTLSLVVEAVVMVSVLTSWNPPRRCRMPKLAPL